MEEEKRMARIISRSRIQPATNKEQTQTINLTPWDIQFLLVGTIQKGVLFHTPQILPQESNQVIHRLKTSLSHTLDFFYPLAGRFASVQNPDDNTTSFFIDCNNAGAEFVHAIADNVTVADILNPLYSPSSIIVSFFSLNGMLNCECSFRPFLAAQVTELVDGFFVGCTISHAVADGTSFWHFFNTWSEISRNIGSEFICNNPPVLERFFLENADCPIRLPPLPAKQVSKTSTVLPPWRERVFHFSKEKIAALKAKANAEMGTNKISSLQALLAHIWRSVIRNRHVNPDQEVNFIMGIGDRPRLNPPLPNNYFGNAVRLAKVSVTARELLAKGLGYTAWQMKKKVDSQTEQVVREFLENPKVISGLGELLTNALGVSSSPRFNVYGVDFGWGRPVAVRSGCANKSDGKITLFAGVEEGSVDIEACFYSDTLEAMGNDEEFMDAVSRYNYS